MIVQIIQEHRRIIQNVHRIHVVTIPFCKLMELVSDVRMVLYLIIILEGYVYHNQVLIHSQQLLHNQRSKRVPLMPDK